MKKYIAFLRGINVGNIRIKMHDLKNAFQEMGFQNAETYLQTGNVVFESEKNISEIKVIIEKGLTETFHYQAFVLLYDFDVLAEIVANYPFEKDEANHAYVVFVESEAVFEELATISESLEEEIAKGNTLLYWKVPKGKSLDTPFAKITAKAKYKSTTTIRNINTLEKMLE
ncbi:DUF1697 domain-containing protein [Emticicia sp. W12TSBA100-4]|uniref:DUF1697 domain-containing protein n=1 Tax=Emticicia sp. W12TSBA100-4 TaxID=3160965 RepID=UPI0033061252